MSGKNKKVLKMAVSYLMIAESSNEKEIELAITVLTAIINGKISQESYDSITEALKPLILKKESKI